MRRQLLAWAAATAGLTLLAVFVGTEPVLAAGTSDIGKNVGDEIKTWATALLLGVAALVAFPLLAKRDVGGAVTLALLVVLVGGFAFAPGSIKDVINSFWHSVAL